jgi:hypothetical protein
MGFTMSQISGRGADQFSDLVAVGELGAIDFDNRSRISQQTFRTGFDDPGLAGAGGSEKKEIANRVRRPIHAGEIRLVHVDDLADGLILSHDSLAEIGAKFLRIGPRKREIQCFSDARYDLIRS